MGVQRGRTARMPIREIRYERARAHYRRVRWFTVMPKNRQIFRRPIQQGLSDDN